MDIKARITDVARGLNGGFRLTFATDEDIRGSVEALQDTDLRLQAHRWRRMRSLNANAYYYVLLGKIAEKAGETLTAVHNETIADYGQPEGQTVLMRDGIDWRNVAWLHLKPTPQVEVVDSELYRAYMVMRGSHTYDSVEMSALIEGTIFEAKNLGIETLTPAELERMMTAYEKHYRKQRD